MKTLITLSFLLHTTLAFAGPVDTTKAVIHHTASPDWTTVEDIDRWHRERGFDQIGYHYVIYKDGSIHKGRSLSKKGAHARTGRPYSRNHYVGIALVGEDDFSEAQLESLNKLIQDLGITHIDKHHEKCPGPGIDLMTVKLSDK